MVISAHTLAVVIRLLNCLLYTYLSLGRGMYSREHLLGFCLVRCIQYHMLL